MSDAKQERTPDFYRVVRADGSGRSYFDNNGTVFTGRVDHAMDSLSKAAGE